MANIQDCPGFEPFGEDVKAARKKRRLSRQKVAEMANISVVYLENNHVLPSLPVIIQLIQIFGLPSEKYFNPLLAGDENDQRQRISRKVMICPEVHLPVIEGALDGAIEESRIV